MVQTEGHGCSCLPQSPSVGRRRNDAQVARAGDLAHWLVRSSTLHPAFRGTTLLWDMRMGGYPDPTVRRLEKQFEGFTVALQRAAYRRALALVAARRPVIETVAEELLDGSRCAEAFALRSCGHQKRTRMPGSNDIAVLASKMNASLARGTYMPG